MVTDTGCDGTGQSIPDEAQRRNLSRIGSFLQDTGSGYLGDQCVPFTLVPTGGGRNHDDYPPNRQDLASPEELTKQIALKLDERKFRTQLRTSHWPGVPGGAVREIQTAQRLSLPLEGHGSAVDAPPHSPDARKKNEPSHVFPGPGLFLHPIQQLLGVVQFLVCERHEYPFLGYSYRCRRNSTRLPEPRQRVQVCEYVSSRVRCLWSGQAGQAAKTRIIGYPRPALGRTPPAMAPAPRVKHRLAVCVSAPECDEAPAGVESLDVAGGGGVRGVMNIVPRFLGS